MKTTKKPHVALRLLAAKVLAEVTTQRLTLDEALAKVAIGQPRDRDWLLEVCAGVLRQKSKLEWILSQYAAKGVPSGKPGRLLLLATYQLLENPDLPPAWIISETVDAVKQEAGPAGGGFANAILRQVAEQAAAWRTVTLNENTPVPQQAALLGMPEWLWKELVRERGFDWACGYAQSSMKRPDHWMRRIDTRTPSRVEDAGGFESIRPDLEAGNVLIQDLASQILVEKVVCSLEEANRGTEQPVLDACAAPGGKAVGLAWSGVKVVATDENPKRTQKLKENVDRLVKDPTQLTVKGWDEAWSSGPYRAIWIDAPCSATGTLRKNPEVRWLKEFQQVVELEKVQYQLIKKAWETLPVGGALVYSVCSVLKREGESQIERLTKSLPAGSVEKAWSIELAPHLDLNREDFERGFPPEKRFFSPDGFFAALLFKRS